MPGRLLVTQERVNVINIETHAKCSMAIRGTTITNFKVSMELNVYVKVHNSTLSFTYQSHKLVSTTFEQEPDFPLKSKQMMDIIIDQSMVNLANDPLFGSGWELGRNRKEPHIMNAEDYTLIYD